MTIQQQLDSGLSHHHAGRLAEAQKIYRRILTQQPNHHEALHLLGMLAAQLGQMDAAVELIRRAIAVCPTNPSCYNNLGNALKTKGQLEQAIVSYQQAIQLNADFVEAHGNLGIALREVGRPSDAVASFRHAVRLNPNHAGAHSNLANALRDTGQLDAAIAAFRDALRLDPNLAEAHNNLGSALKSIGQLDESVAAFRQAIRLKPDYVYAHCNLVFALQFHPGYDANAIHGEHLRWNQQHAEPLRKFIQPHANSPDPDRQLCIGYVSADFRNHSVSRFLLPLFRQHDHGAFKIFCYSDVMNSDSMTDRLRACADVWHNIVGHTNQRVADMVHQDKIDILVDLAGHTAINRLRVFARKAAPVQVSYLGYPGSTGLSAMDHRLTDALADPPGQTELPYGEKPLRLPLCNWCFSEPDDAPPVGPLPAESAASICFGTFNNFAKASPAVMDLWAAILIATPSSRLLIKSRGLNEQSVRERIHQHFASRGVQADRLEIRGHEPNALSHLEAYNQMDIALDTFPYHGTTTTCEALWMGVPVVTLAGKAHVSRVGVSLLSNVGLPGMIGRSADEYVSIAVGLAKDLPRLAELRRTLRSRMRASPLMDAPRFARDIEAAYRQVWRIWCEQPGNSALQCPSQ